MIIIKQYGKRRNITREEIKKILPVIKDFDKKTGKKPLSIIKIMEEFAEGKTIQFKIDKGEWIDLETPTFLGNVRDYRIKPE